MNVSSFSSEADSLIDDNHGGMAAATAKETHRRGRRRFWVLVVGAVLLAILAISFAFWHVGEDNEEEEVLEDFVVVEDEELNSRGVDGGGGTPYRPFCEYWKGPTPNRHARSDWTVFQEGVQTSMTQPSQQWSTIPCLPVHHLQEQEEELIPKTASRWFGRHSDKDPTAAANQAEQEELEQRLNPLLVNNYHAPDAILQVNFSDRIFDDRSPIYGFGGAFTESSALNYQRLSSAGKEAVIELLFGATGLGYALGRVHINSCDFSVKSYSFDDVNGDFELEHFDMGVHHDVQSGMVDMALRASSVLKQAWSSSNEEEDDERLDGNLLLLASPWSPPAWMKAPTSRDSNESEHAETMLSSAQPVCVREGVGPTSPYARTWALYFSKFLTAYANLGLPIWAVTVQNEPEFPAPWEACAFSVENETEFVANHLGPRLQEDHPDVKLFVFDHNTDHINDWMEVLLNETLGARSFVDGFAYHWYAGGMDRLLDGALGNPNMHRLMENLGKQEQQDKEEEQVVEQQQESGTSTQQELPIPEQKPPHLVLGSESCHCPTTGYAGGDLRVVWARAERYVHTILADLASGSNGWIDWNLILDSIGGPNHLGNLCESMLLSAPHRAQDADADTIPPLPDFESDHPFGNVNIGDGRTREELNAMGFPAKYLDVGVVVQPLYYYMGHISRYVRPGSYAVSALITTTTSSHDHERIFRPRGSVVVGGGENDLARHGIEITLWPCEGSTRQRFYWDFDQGKHITVRGHDWLGHPTKTCFGSEEDLEYKGLRLTDCENAKAGVYSVLPITNTTKYKIVLLNHPSTASPPCLVVQKLSNNGGAYGPRGGAQVTVGSCEEESAIWSIDSEFGEASSTFLGDEVCMTTGWPFLQMGAFVTPGNNMQKTVVLLNEASDSANFALKDGNKLVVTSSIPARSIQTYVLK